MENKTNKTPAIRFKGFKEDWEETTLNEIAESFSCSSLTDSDKKVLLSIMIR